MNRKTLSWLQRELRAWQAEGLLNEEQARSILARPAYSALLRRAPGGRLVYLFGVLGGILVGVGLILFFSSNWRAIPDAGKLALIFAGLLGSYGVALAMRFRQRPSTGLSAGFFLLGAIVYGSAIHLIAQIYNFHADWRTGVLYWFLGTLPLAYIIDSRPVLWLSLGTLVFWLGTKVGLETLGLLFLYLMLGAVLVLVGLRHEEPFRLPRFAKIYVSLGVGLILGSTLTLSFGGALENFSSERLPPSFWPYVMVLLAIYVATLVGMAWQRQHLPDRGRRRLAAYLSLALLPCLLLFTQARPGDAIVALANVLLFAEFVGLVVYGVAVRSNVYLNLGLTFFFLGVLCKYFDSYWESLPRSLFFLGGGTLLFVVGYWADRKRRRWHELPEAAP